MSTTHAKVSSKTDSADTTLIRPSDWNADHVDNIGFFNVLDYGAVANGTTDDGPAFCAAYTAASASGNVQSPATLLVPPGQYRIATSIIVKSFVRLMAYGAELLGPITGADKITSYTAPAALLDVTAQTAGACFIDDGGEGVTRASFEGLTVNGFRWGFVTLGISWPHALWQSVYFYDCNVGIFIYRAAQGPRVIDTFSYGGTTFVGSATCFAEGHPYLGMEYGFTEMFVYDNRRGWGADASLDNPSFDDWFVASILRPDTLSVPPAGGPGSLLYPFTGTALHVSGRNIYIPGRSKYHTGSGSITNAISYLCPRGVALVASPLNFQFARIGGEFMFGDGPDAMVTIPLRNMSPDFRSQAEFESIDSLNATDPGYTISVLADPSAPSVRGTYYTSAIHGPVQGAADHFVSLPGLSGPGLPAPEAGLLYASDGPRTASWASTAWVARAAYEDMILRTPDLVGYWRLGESSGTNANDLSTSNNDGTYASVTLAQTGLLVGNAGTSTLFAGTSGSRVSGMTAPAIDLSHFSVAVWAKTSATGTHGLVSYRTTGGNDGFGMWMSNHKLVGLVGEDIIGSESVIDDGAAHLMVLTYNKPTTYIDGLFNLSVDGVPAIDEWPVTATTFASCVLLIGNNNYDQGWGGTIQEVAIFDRALSGFEQKMMYRVGSNT